MNIVNILNMASQMEASDVHLVVGNPATVRIDGVLRPLDDSPLSNEDTRMYARYILSDHQYKKFDEMGQIDLAYRLEGGKAFRVNVFKYSEFVGIACRVIKDNIPTARELELPEVIETVSNYTSGLVLVTGPTGCGKSTTIATIVDAINKKKNCHILTIEDPIEYIHKNEMSIITQREVGRDCLNFADALRAGLRQDPDVIMVGEMRDLETISTAVTAAETGHLVLATLHTRNTYQTIERIIDVFPSDHQQQIRIQLANSLMAIFSQRLLPRKKTNGRIAAVESLIVNHAVRNLIRENKTHQLYTTMQTGQRLGMQTMDDYLMKLYQTHVIDRITLLENVTEKETVLKIID